MVGGLRRVEVSGSAQFSSAVHACFLLTTAVETPSTLWPLQNRNHSFADTAVTGTFLKEHGAPRRGREAAEGQRPPVEALAGLICSMIPTATSSFRARPPPPGNASEPATARKEVPVKDHGFSRSQFGILGSHGVVLSSFFNLGLR